MGERPEEANTWKPEETLANAEACESLPGEAHVVGGFTIARRTSVGIMWQGTALSGIGDPKKYKSLPAY